MTARFRPEAEAELDEAVDFYEARKSGLGLEFAREAQASVLQIQQRPEAWAPIGRSCRRYNMNRFPYAIIYAIEPSGIIVIAVMHQKRRPGYWRKRLRQT